MESGQLATVIIAFVALWVAVAATLSLIAVMRIRRAQALLGAARDWKGLLDAAPARPAVLYPDGRLEADRLLLRDIGIEGEPARLEDLASPAAGFAEDDVRVLSDALSASALSGKSVAKLLHIKR